MTPKWSDLLIFLIFILQITTNATEDLLDQYVKHVESVNSINYNLDKRYNKKYHHPKSRRKLHGFNDIDEYFKESQEDTVFFDLLDSFPKENSGSQKPENDRHLLRKRSVVDSGSESPEVEDFDLLPDIDEESKHREKRDASSDIAWTHSETLDREGRIILRWQPRHQEILFRVEAKTRGYIGLGFSSDGKMEKADIILGWVDDKTGVAVLMDCHGVPTSQGSAPVRDEIDNYTLMRGLQNDTHTVIEFRRAFDTCDPDDYVLSGDTVRIIWALHEYDPQRGAEMVYHGENRGHQSVHLLGPPPVAKMSIGHSSHWDVVFDDFKITEEVSTMYWCKVFKAPTLNSKHHIVGFEPIIGDKHSNLVHHMVMHECELDVNEDVAIWEQFSKEKGKPCYSNTASLWDKCLTPLVAWAIGSKGENFPNHVGVPLAEKKHSFYMLEVHFDNPKKKSGLDTSGLRLHYTSELRENEAGILITGVAPSTLHFIPPYQKDYKTAGYCSIDCTKEVIPKEGINVVSVMLHSHLAAKKLKLRHIRAMKELTPLAEDNRYDFNYQQSRSLSQDIPILPGDGLITECTYSTLNRSKPTLGGYSTQDEMCLAFVLHYPRTQLAGCYSMPPVKYFFENLGIKEFYGKDMNQIEKALLEGRIDGEPATSTLNPFITKPGDELSSEANHLAIVALKNAKDYVIEGYQDEWHAVFDKLVIKEPQEFRNLTFTEHLHNMPYNETIFTKTMEKYFYEGLHLTFCRKRDDTLAINELIVKLPEFQQYERRENIQCSYRSKTSYTSQENGAFSSSVKVWMMTRATLTYYSLLVSLLITGFV
ncbi:MOXD1 homolog 1 [Diabrotica virgifera virgifera]|uniref:DOMON domain-containing protein n=1 Tax=Diabrotica virgifera virgifera TaxID=50390 RepID=A0ABM5IZA7_DIAVI|nr:MOXD1 homolog 1 [Diabrotica virgifera virgifera]